MNVRRCLLGAALLAVLAVLSGAGAAPATAVGIAQRDTEGYGRMMLVLDSSGSMAEPAGGGGTKIAAAKKSLRTVVEGLPDEAQVGLRVFGAEVFSRTDPGSCRDSQQVVEPGSDNREDLLSAIEEYEPYGETPIPYALQQAAEDLGDEGARSIVLVSDGESTCRPDPCETAGELVDKGIDLKIDVVGLSVSGAARQQLQCIADAGGGSYYDADSAEDVEGDLTRVAERAIRPFTLTGSPIDGGTEQAPTPIEVGDWIDTFGPSGSQDAVQSYVFDRTVDGSTLRVSAVTQGRRGDEGLRVEVLDPEGDRCDYSSALRQIDARDVLGVQATASEETDCSAAGQYLVNVERRLGDEQDVRVGLRVTEQPPFTDPGFEGDGEVDVTAPQVSGPANEAVGGTSFANATELETGRYTSTIVPGEALMYKIALDHGQAARVQVTFPPASQAIQDLVGIGGPLSNVMMYNPMQALLDNPSGSSFSEAVGDDEQHVLRTATAEVSRSAFDAGGTNGVADYSTAGDYYVGVSLKREDFTAEFPITIDVEVVGEPQPGPTYADAASWSVAEGAVGEVEASESAGPEPEEADEGEPAAAAPEEGAGTTRTVGGVLAGVLGLAVIAAAVLLLLRRRASRGGGPAAG